MPFRTSAAVTALLLSLVFSNRVTAQSLTPPDSLTAASELARDARTKSAIAPEEALSEVDRAIARLGNLPTADRKTRAQFAAVRARILLNLGRVHDARIELKSAVDDLGGLTPQATATDVTVRADLALAALLDGDRATGAQYLAYSGSGLGFRQFPHGKEMLPPPCGTGSGLSRDDLAIIEFAITQEGSVVHPEVIYASRPGPQVAQFSDAVARWSWAPEQARNMPAGLRQLLTVLIRRDGELGLATVA